MVVSFLTTRHPGQQTKATALLLQAADGEHQLVVSQITLFETVFVLRNLYSQDPFQIRSAVHDFLALPGVEPVNEVGWPKVLEVWPEQLPSFADAVLAVVAKQSRCDAVATFDRRLAGWLRRNGPAPYW